jgi:L-ribulokinase
MQIYADVTGREFKIAGSTQTPALGSAMFGAVSAGKARGGYDSIYEAAPVMGKLKDEAFKPNPEAKKVTINSLLNMLPQVILLWRK